MSLEHDLGALPNSQWTTRRAVVLDWYDGPRRGVCALSVPDVEFSFELLDERPNPDDLDDRLYRLKELPPGSVDRVLGFLAALQPADAALWVPLWKFPSEAQQREAERAIDQVLNRAQASPVVIATRDMEHFLGYWSVEQQSLNGSADWFAALGISQEQLSGRP